MRKETITEIKKDIKYHLNNRQVSIEIDRESVKNDNVLVDAGAIDALDGVLSRLQKQEEKEKCNCQV